VRNFIVSSTLILAVFSACRTPGERSSAALKQSQNASACDPKGVLAELNPGGLFATKRVLYNQPRVEKDWIHPAMTEKSSAGNLGLFHNFVPDEQQAKKTKKIISALAILTKDLVSAKSGTTEISPDKAELTGKSDITNIFSIDSEALLRLKTIKFDVPSKSSNIVILKGSTPALRSVVIAGDVSSDKLLFVLPEAGTFRVQGEKFFGTVIAPDTAVFMESTFNGSIYAGEISVREPMTRSFYNGCLLPEKK